MMGLPTLIRLQRAGLDQKRRRLADLEARFDDLRSSLADLEAEVCEQQRIAAASEEVGFAYADYAAAAIRRRHDLERAMAELDIDIAAARAEVGEAFRELKKLEIVRERREREALAEENRREQIILDDLGLEMHRRRPSTSA